MYNRRPNKYKTYDKIYFIVDKHLSNDYIEALEEAFKDHNDFIKDIKEFEMSNQQNPNKKTTFINIRLNSKDLNEGIFTSLSKKINKIISKKLSLLYTEK